MADEKTWREFDEDTSKMLKKKLKGSAKEKLEVIGDLIYDFGEERFGVDKPRERDPVSKPSRRQRIIARLKKELRCLKHKWRKAVSDEKPGLEALQRQVRQKLDSLKRAERQRVKRKDREKARRAFFQNPHRFTKKLFEQSKSGTLNIQKKDLEGHLRGVYSDEHRDAPMPDIGGLVRPPQPGVEFDVSEPRFKEVASFIEKARAASAPGPNGVPYKVYKKCEKLKRVLWRLLKVVWRKDVVPLSWNKADGVYIPKEENSSTIGQFRPISLLNVEGKIMLGVLASRVTSFLLENGLVNTSVQKAGVPGFSGCLEHSSMIWHTIQSAKKSRKSLSVVWLDLANAYGSVPHALIKFAMQFLWIPDKVTNYVMQYYDNFHMRFSTTQYTTEWQRLEVGIPMGCAISPILFVLAMEVMTRSAERMGPGVSLEGSEELPSIRAFMDDLTLLNPNTTASQRILDRLDELMVWARMKFKTKKSRSLVLKQGTLTDYHFNLSGEQIPTIQEQPVKSLGRWYTEDLKDTKRVQETAKLIREGLEAIDNSGLPGKLKLWCLQYGLMPRIMWPLTVYEVALSHVEAMERNINTYVKKWLGVPNSLTNIAIHSRKAKLNIPVRSLVEEFKVAKVRTSMTLSNSKDPVIRNFQPDLRSGRKWRVSAAVEEAEARLRHKEVVGATQTGRQGLGLIRHKWWSSATEKERREMVVQEVREQEEEKRVAVAAGQAKQGMWTTWESVEQRNISFNVLWQMEPLRISFLWRSTYDLLPTPANLSKWYEERSDCCAGCGQKGTLQHILSACPSALSSGKYTWRHNNVLRVIVDAIKGRVECVNAEEVPAGNQYFTPFLKEGSQPRKDTSSKRKPSILSAANDWKVKADLDGEGGFPQEIALTLLRPDIVIWSESSREVVFGELSVPWEGNIEEAYERKLTRYAELEAVCRDKGWRSSCYPFELGCRGFVAASLHKWLNKMGLSRKEIKSTTRAAAEAAEAGSAWIWNKYLLEERRKRSNRYHSPMTVTSRQVFRTLTPLRTSNAAPVMEQCFKSQSSGLMATAHQWVVVLFALLAPHPEGILN
ncbi:uncharacterized protein LOC144915086 [Branchiostoma floridae x Branchiostoma belcheri]